MAVLLHDEGVIAAPGDGRAEEAKQIATLSAEVDKRIHQSVDKGLRAGTKVSYAMMVEHWTKQVLVWSSARWNHREAAEQCRVGAPIV